MWTFQYKHGDRPLEGYTIQRAAGRGGFGEVYYAISDSGREVALKVVQGYEQIELRGISQCMNLKSPHLVTIFDVKYNAEGKPFVIMEFVSGMNLRQLIDESPAGLGTQKAAFFLREIAKGLSFLHDCGIVHRDLKPANIFYENGYVKIGDYGLSKAITTSQHSGQTVTVGTVHYMAPEIGAGKYDRSIDIYAMGAVLYEMLTGMPPYVGASPAEVLMKHLSSEPDVSNIPQPFARVIQKAMAKDPNVRYRTVQEMVEDVFGTEHVRQSVSVFSTEDLSVIAERVAKKATVAVGAGAGGGGGGMGGGPSSSLPGGAQPDVWGRMGSWIDDVGGRMRHAWHKPGSAAAALAETSPPPQSAYPAVINDPLPGRHRWNLALLVSLLAPLASMLVRPEALRDPVLTFLFVLVVMWGAAVGLLLAHRSILPRMGNDSIWVQRLVAGQMASLIAIVAALPIWIASGNLKTVGATLLAILAQYFIFDTKKEIVYDRYERVALGHLFGAGLVAFIVSLIFRGHTHLAIAAAAGVSLIVQILSPWDPAAAARAKAAKKYGDEDEEDEDEDEDEEGKSKPPQPKVRPESPGVAAVKIDLVTGKVQRIPADQAATHAGSDAGTPSGRRRGPRPFWWRPVWLPVRIAWLVAFVLLIPIGIVFCVASAYDLSSDFGALVAAGVSSLMLGVGCGLQALRTRFYGWWGYLIKPLLLAVCAVTLTSSAIVMGNLPSFRPNTEEIIIGTFLIVFPALLFLVLLFLPGRFRVAAPAGPFQMPSESISPSRRSWAIVLCGLYFFSGAGGLHRLYVGRVKSGILWLLTFGLMGIGQIVDLVLILCGKFTDVHGRAVLNWQFEGPMSQPAQDFVPSPPPVEETQPRSADSPFAGIEQAAHQVVGAMKNVVNDVTAGLGAGFRLGSKGASDAWGDEPQTTAATAVKSWTRPQPRAIVIGGDFNIRGILSALAGLFIFVAVLMSLALAIDVPGMLNAGVPTLDVKTELETGIFRDLGPQWPTLMRQAAMVTVGAVLLVALTLLMFARQTGGIMHMLRGAIGVGGLVLATLPLSSAFQRQGGWRNIGMYISHKDYAEASNQIMQNLQTAQTVLAAVIFLAAVIILAWPPRKARVEATPVPDAAQKGA